LGARRDFSGIDTVKEDQEGQESRRDRKAGGTGEQEGQEIRSKSGGDQEMSRR
jgi:hypothetical protein